LDLKLGIVLNLKYIDLSYSLFIYMPMSCCWIDPLLSPHLCSSRNKAWAHFIYQKYSIDGYMACSEMLTFSS